MAANLSLIVLDQNHDIGLSSIISVTYSDDEIMPIASISDYVITPVNMPSSYGQFIHGSVSYGGNAVNPTYTLRQWTSGLLGGLIFCFAESSYKYNYTASSSLTGALELSIAGSGGKPLPVSYRFEISDIKGNVDSISLRGTIYTQVAVFNGNGDFLQNLGPDTLTGISLCYDDASGNQHILWSTNSSPGRPDGAEIPVNDYVRSLYFNFDGTLSTIAGAFTFGPGNSYGVGFGFAISINNDLDAGILPEGDLLGGIYDSIKDVVIPVLEGIQDTVESIHSTLLPTPSQVEDANKLKDSVDGIQSEISDAVDEINDLTNRPPPEELLPDASQILPDLSDPVVSAGYNVVQDLFSDAYITQLCLLFIALAFLRYVIFGGA